MQHCIPDEETARQKALVYPNVIAVAMAASHDDHAKPGPECDDQFEFEFAVDLVLGGFDVLRQRSWRSANRAGGCLIE